MAYLVVGHPGPVARAVIERLVEMKNEVIVIGAPDASLPTAVEQLTGHCEKIDFGLSGSDYGRLCGRVERMFVAETTEQLPESKQGFRDIEAARPIRVASEVVEFAHASTSLDSVVYLSSFAVFGDVQGTVFEKDFELGQSFSRQRDEVLAVAEKQIHRLGKTKKLAIVRAANLVGHERSGETLSGAELGRLAKFAVAAPDECEFSFSDLPLHFETVERASEALILANPASPPSTMHLIDDDPWTDRQIIKWLFDRVSKTIIEVPRTNPSALQFLRAATIQSGRVRTSKAVFERGESVRQMGKLLSRDVDTTLAKLFGRDEWGGLS